MLPKTKARLKALAQKEATDLPNARVAEAKTRTALLARRAVAGDIDELDLASLDALGRIKGQLKNTYLESISAAKITSATMLATTLTLAGTEASNNKTSLVMIGDALMRVNDGIADRLRLSNAGIEIGDSDEGISPTVVAGRGIFNIGSKHSGITSFVNPSRRGWSIRADGTGAGAPNGHLFLIATRSANSEATQTSNWASLEAQIDHSGTGAIANRSGVIIRNMLWSAGPARIGGAMDVLGALNADGALNANSTLDANAATYLNAGIARRDAGNLQFNRGLDVNVGDIRLTAASAQGIRSIGGTPLDLYAPTSFVRVNDSLRAVSGLVVVGATSLEGLTVSGALNIPANTITATELRGSSTDDTLRAVHQHHIKDGSMLARHFSSRAVHGANIQLESLGWDLMGLSNKNRAQDDSSMRSIGALLGGTALNVASANHSHGSGNTLDFDMLGDARVEKILKLRDALRARKNATGAVSRAEYNGLLALTLILAHILFDAPDLSADERLAKRRAGETGWDDFMFEWRRGKQLAAASEGKATAEGEYLHHPSLKHYANPTPDVTDIPA